MTLEPSGFSPGGSSAISGDASFGSDLVALYAIPVNSTSSMAGAFYPTMNGSYCVLPNSADLGQAIYVGSSPVNSAGRYDFTFSTLPWSLASLGNSLYFFTVSFDSTGGSTSGLNPFVDSVSETFKVSVGLDPTLQ